MWGKLSPANNLSEFLRPISANGSFEIVNSQPNFTSTFLFRRLSAVDVVLRIQLYFHNLQATGALYDQSEFVGVVHQEGEVYRLSKKELTNFVKKLKPDFENHLQVDDLLSLVSDTTQFRSNHTHKQGFETQPKQLNSRGFICILERSDSAVLSINMALHMDRPKHDSHDLDDSIVLHGSFNPNYDDMYRFKVSKTYLNLVLTHESVNQIETGFKPAEVYDIVSRAPSPIRLYFAELLSIKSDNNFHTLILPRYGPNIFEVLKNNSFRGFSMENSLKISFDILSAVNHLHGIGIIHTNLSSVVFRFRTEQMDLITDAHSTYFSVRDTRIVLCDLTGCRPTGTYQDRIQRDIYRAPEVLMGLKWSSEVDYWSVGCILSEVFCGSPLFESQAQAMDPDLYQLTHIMTYCGIVPYAMIEKANPKFQHYPKKFIYTNNDYCVGNPEFENMSFNVLYRIIRGLMHYDPYIRISCGRALESDVFTHFVTDCNGFTKQRKRPHRGLEENHPKKKIRRLAPRQSYAIRTRNR